MLNEYVGIFGVCHYMALDLGRPVDVVYLNFQKAFDRPKVPHLLKKIKAHGITGDVLRWIYEWLKDREQRVVLNF